MRRRRLQTGAWSPGAPEPCSDEPVGVVTQMGPSQGRDARQHTSVLESQCLVAPGPRIPPSWRPWAPQRTGPITSPVAASAVLKPFWLYSYQSSKLASPPALCCTEIKVCGFVSSLYLCPRFFFFTVKLSLKNLTHTECVWRARGWRVEGWADVLNSPNWRFKTCITKLVARIQFVNLSPSY